MLRVVDHDWWNGAKIGTSNSILFIFIPIILFYLFDIVPGLPLSCDSPSSNAMWGKFIMWLPADDWLRKIPIDPHIFPEWRKLKMECVFQHATTWNNGPTIRFPWLQILCWDGRIWLWFCVKIVLFWVAMTSKCEGRICMVGPWNW